MAAAWVRSEKYVDKKSQSQSFGSGSHMGQITMTRVKWMCIARVAISRGVLTILFLEYHFTRHTRMCRVLKLSESGEHFLTSPCPVPIASDALAIKIKTNRESADKGNKREITPRPKQFLPRMKELLQEKSTWRTLSEEQYRFPGFNTEEGVMYHCVSYKAFRLAAAKDLHFVYTDNQLSISHSTLATKTIDIDGEKMAVCIHRSLCQGVKYCPVEGCSYVVSTRQKVNRCNVHTATNIDKVRVICNKAQNENNNIHGAINLILNFREQIQ